MFETFIKDLINKYLGVYFEQLDGSQLKFSFFKGYASFQNLKVKPDVLKEFKLPFKIPYGHLDKLNIKIPFSDLFNESFVVELEGLHILMIPVEAECYDANTENKIEYDAKMSEVERIISTKNSDTPSSKDPSKDSSFLQRLTIQIFKNLQVVVKDIHVRYEDGFSLSKSPFSLGISIPEFYLKTEDNPSEKLNYHEFVKKIMLKAFSVYLNNDSELVYNLSSDKIAEHFKRNNLSHQKQIFLPINFVSRAYINTHSDLDNFNKPEILFDIMFDDIAISFTRNQYRLLIQYNEALGRIQNRRQFLKYKPKELWQHRTAANLWKFATHAVYEHCVHMPKKTWKWEYIKEFRQKRREYIDLWIKSLEDKLKADEEQELKSCQSFLDVFNIVMCREEAIIKFTKKKSSSSSSKGWLSGWWGKKKDIVESAEQGVLKIVAEELSAEEKQKLFKAVGADKKDENGLPIILTPSYPRGYVSARVSVDFREFKVCFINEDLKNRKIMEMTTKGVTLDLNYRPAIKASKIKLAIGTYSLSGWIEDDSKPAPLIVTTKANSELDYADFVNVEFEQYPEDLVNFDNKFILRANPLEIVYDADSFDQIVKFFMVPSEIKLDTLTSMVQEQFLEAKDMTMAGLKYFASKRNYSFVSISIKSGYLIIPQNGRYKNNCRLLYIDLGSLHISTSERNAKVDNDSSYQDSAFDFYDLKISSVEIQLVDEGVDFHQLKSLSDHIPSYLLHPLSLDLTLRKCLLKKSNFADFAVSCIWPTISVDITDRILFNLTELLVSVPFPELDKIRDEMNYEDVADCVTYSNFAPIDTNEKRKLTKQLISDDGIISKDSDSEVIDESAVEAHNGSGNNDASVLFEIDFVLKCLQIRICEFDEKKQKVDPIFVLAITEIGLQMRKSKFETVLIAKMVSLELSSLNYIGRVEETAVGRIEEPVKIVNSFNFDKTDANLLSIKLKIIDKNAPNFIQDHKNIRHALEVNMSDLDVCLHLESWNLICSFVERFTEKLAKCQASIPHGRREVEKSKDATSGPGMKKTKLEGINLTATDAVFQMLDKKDERKNLRLSKFVNNAKAGIHPSIPDLIIEQWNITACLQQLSIRLNCNNEDISKVAIRKLSVNLAKTYLMTRIYFSLDDFFIMDYSRDMRSNANIFSMRDSSQVFSGSMTLYDPGAKLTFRALKDIYGGQIEERPGRMSHEEIEKRIQNKQSYLYSENLTNVEAFYKDLMSVLGQCEKNNISMEVNIGKILVVFHSKFWNKFLNFILKFSGKSNDKKDVKKTKNLPNESKKGPEVNFSLELIIEDPRIFVPAYHNVDEGFLLEILSIKSNLISNNDRKLVADETQESLDFKTELESLSISRVKNYKKDENKTSEGLSVPISGGFKINMISYLDPQDKKTKKSMLKIQSIFEEFHIKLSQLNYTFLLDVINNNLLKIDLEAEKEAKKGERTQIKSEKYSFAYKDDQVNLKNEFKNIEMRLTSRIDQRPDFTIEIGLKKGIVEIFDDKNDNLALINFTDYVLDMKSFPDEKFLVMKLGNLEAIDNRDPEMNATVLSLLTGRLNEQKFFFQMESVSSNDANKTFIEVENIRVRTNLEYALLVKKFLTTLSEPIKTKKDGKLPKLEMGQDVLALESEQLSKKKQSTKTNDLVIKVNKSEVILANESTDNSQSDVILCDIGLCMQMHSIDERMVLSVTLETALNIVPADFIDNRSNAKEILSPVLLTTGIDKNSDLELYIEGNIPSVSIRISALDLRKVLNILQTSKETLKKQEIVLDQTEENVQDYNLPNDFWTAREIDQELKATLMSLERADSKEEKPNDFLHTLNSFTNKQKLTIISFKIKEIDLIIETHRQANNALFNFQSSLIAESLTTKNKMLTSLNFFISGKYMNDWLDTWHPLWEKVPIEGQREKCNIIIDYSKTIENESESDEVLSTVADSSLIIKVVDRLELTLTHDVILSCKTFFNDLSKKLSTEGQRRSVFSRESINLSSFVNRTGYALELIIDLEKFRPLTTAEKLQNKQVALTPTKPDEKYGLFKMPNYSYLYFELCHEQIGKTLSDMPVAWISYENVGTKVETLDPIQTSQIFDLNQLKEINSLPSTRLCSKGVRGKIISLEDLGSRILNIPSLKHNLQTPVMVETRIAKRNRTVDIRSYVQIINNSEDAINVYASAHTHEKPSLLFKLASSCSYPIPLCLAKYGDLFIKPDDAKVNMSSNSLTIPDGQDPDCLTSFKILSCSSNDPTNENYAYYSISYIQREDDLSVNENPMNLIRVKNNDGQLVSRRITAYHISIRSATYIDNLLPFDIQIRIGSNNYNIRTGKSEPIRQLQGISGHFVFEFKYLGDTYECDVALKREAQPIRFIQCTKSNDPTKVLTIGLQMDTKEKSIYCSLFAPYWLINKTSQIITYKVEDDSTVEHDPSQTPYVIHCLPKKSVFGSYKMMMKIFDSNFSDKFSIDTVGSSGRVICKGPDNSTYILGVHINLGASGLTKVVTIAPYFAIVNDTQMSLEFKECISETGGRPEENGDWIKIPEKDAVGFWPKKKNLDSKNIHLFMKCRARGDLETEMFPFHKSHSTLVRCRQNSFALVVNVQTTDAATVISLQSNNIENSIPVMVNNLQTGEVVFYQNENTKKNYLLSNQCCRYYWEDVLSEKTLSVIICANELNSKRVDIDIQQDSFGEIKLENETIYWVSFWYKTRRYVLFTSSVVAAKNAAYNAAVGKGETDILFILNSFGLSLVQDMKRDELAYFSIQGSGTRWNKVMKNQRQKSLPEAVSQAIEKKYLVFAAQHEEKGQDSTNKRPLLPSPAKGGEIVEVEVDFEKNLLLKPEKCEIVQVMEPGVSVHLKLSKNQYQVHLKVFSVQLDDQRESSIFPVVLATKQITNSMAITQAIKPLLEVSSIVDRMPSGAYRFKYLGLLFQEIDVKVNLQFIFELLEFFQIDNYSKKSFEEELSLMTVNLNTVPTIKSALDQGQKSIFDMIHISPIKATINVSLSKQFLEESTSYRTSIVSHFLNPLGGALDINDVQIRLGFFEKRNAVLSMHQLTSSISHHYTSQFLRQIYCFVLGLDVLGGPYGVFVGFGEGVRDVFYEPAMGAILGPEEFAEGVAIGFKSLFKGTFGSAAGAISKITGVVGRGVAMLTLDKDYQNTRLQKINQKPHNFQSGLARGGVGLYRGFLDGVTGIVNQPKSGLEKDGARGFITGMGKGVIGLVVRPVGGIIDMASTSMEGLKNLTNNTKCIERIRFPRYIEPNRIFNEYDLYRARGYCLLLKVNRDIAKQFIDYTPSSKNSLFLFLTMKAIIEVEYNSSINECTLKNQIDIAYMKKDQNFIVKADKDELSIDFIRDEEKNEQKKFMGIFKKSDNKLCYRFECEESHAKIMKSLIEFQVEKNRLLNAE